MTSPVPKMTYVLPLRSRLTFTFNSLPSIILHASREHEIIIVIDRCLLEHEIKARPAVYPDGGGRLLVDDQTDREHMYRWFDSHQKLLAEHHVRVMDFHGDERCWTGGLRAATAMNMGMASSTTDWVVVFGDEDLIFMKNWDVAMWGVLHDRDPMRYVATPVMVTPGQYDPLPELTPDWIHAQRARCCTQLTYPLSTEYASSLASGRLSYEAFERFAEIGAQAGVRDEACGERSMCHWVPLIMHRKLFDQAGGYPTTDYAASSYDLVFDGKLQSMGITKRMPLDHMILHAKHFAYFSDEVDREWADATWLDRIQKRMIP
jgi:hypothetical protein